MPDQSPPFGAGQPERRCYAPTIDLKATEIAGDAGNEVEPPPSSEQPESPPEQARPARDEKAADNKGSGSRPVAARSGALWLPLGAAIAGAVLTGAIVALMLPAVERDRGVALESRVAQLERQLADFAGGPRASDPELAARLQKLEAQVVAQGAAGLPAGDPALANRVAEIEAEVHSMRDRGVAVESRVAQSERQLAEFAGGVSDPELAARLQKLEAQVAQGGPGSPAGDPASANRLAEIEAEVHSMRDMVEAASSRSEDIAAGLADARRRAEVNAAALAELAQKSEGPSAGATDDLAARLSALADRVGALEARRQGGDDRLVRAALMAGALAGAVERGAPFTGELRAAQGEAADPSLLAPLEPFAASGLPSPPALARELSALEPQLLAAAGAPSAGFLQKLEAHAEKLVRIRPIDEAQAGDAPAAVIARAELKAAHDDLPGALAELARLPDSVRAPAQAWIARGEARGAALAASRSFAAQAFAALGKGAR